MREWLKEIRPILIVVLPLMVPLYCGGARQVGTNADLEQIVGDLSEESKRTRAQIQFWLTKWYTHCDPDGKFFDEAECIKAEEHLIALGEPIPGEDEE